MAATDYLPWASERSRRNEHSLYSTNCSTFVLAFGSGYYTSQTQNQVLLVEEHDFSELSAVMRFHLTYAGPLKSNGSPNHKHDIRRAFHPQLCKLWNLNAHLYQVFPENFSDPFPTPEQFVNSRADKYERAGFRWLPLIDSGDGVRVGIDILMLRDGPAGGIVLRNGDIDNRLKTLFDAFQIPEHKESLPTGAVPGDGENPFCCFLQDDKLIGKVTVETDTLLQPIDGKSCIDPNDVRLFISVEIRSLGGMNSRFA